MDESEKCVTEEQWHRLAALERQSCIRGRAGLREDFNAYLDGVESRVVRAQDAPGERTLWSKYAVDAVGVITGLQDEPYRSSKKDDNFLVSSLCADGLHAPALDIDFGVTATPYKGVTELIIERAIPPRAGEGLSAALIGTGLAKLGVVTLAPSRYTIIVSHVPTRVLPSSTTGHHHLYFDVGMPWESYRDLLDALLRADLINPKWFEMAVRQRMSLLIKPGLTKDQVMARISQPVRGRGISYFSS